MSAGTLALSREALSLDPLVINDGTLYRFTPDGFGTPAITKRHGKAPDAEGVHGSEHVSVAKEETSLPLEVVITAASPAGVDAAFDDLAAALDQWAFTATRVVDGVTRVWSAWSADYSRGPIRAEEQDAHLCTVTITIPVYPIPA